MTENEFSTLSGKQLHEKALHLRESGDLVGSFAAANASILVHLSRNELFQAAEAIACAVITLRVKAGLEENLHVKRNILQQAEGVMRQGVKWAYDSKDPTALALPMYQLAQVQEDLGYYSTAVATYKEAFGNMQQNPPASHNRPSVLADMNIHMATCEYKAGDKSALDRVLQALDQLKNNPDPDEFNQQVWVSGAYMRLADILSKDHPEDARKYLEQAHKIVDQNDALVNRKEQLALLDAKFAS